MRTLNHCSASRDFVRSIDITDFVLVNFRLVLPLIDTGRLDMGHLGEKVEDCSMRSIRIHCKETGLEYLPED